MVISASDQVLGSASKSSTWVQAEQVLGSIGVLIITCQVLGKLLRSKYLQVLGYCKNGTLVTHPVWESAIVKLQNNQEDRLTAAERREVKIYLLPDAPPEVHEGFGDDDFNVGDILFNQEKEAEARSKKSRYRSTKHIFTTSVIVECLFSRAKMILEDRRKSMSPWHMELLLFLHSNRDLWDAHTVNMCMKEPFWSDDEEDPNENDEE